LFAPLHQVDSLSRIASLAMFGFEVLGIIIAIANTLIDAAGLVKRRKSRRNAWKVVPLERSLDIGPPMIREEYDRDFARLGTRFRLGDGKGDVSICFLSRG
jgi:hypothetical protein